MYFDTDSKMTVTFTLEAVPSFVPMLRRHTFLSSLEHCLDLQAARSLHWSYPLWQCFSLNKSGQGPLGFGVRGILWLCHLDLFLEDGF